MIRVSRALLADGLLAQLPKYVSITFPPLSANTLKAHVLVEKL